MANALPPVRGAAFTFPVSLVSQADTDIFKTTVTITTADVWVSKDGAAFAAVTAAPTELQTTPGAANTGVLWQGLTATEMTADIVTVLYHDAAGNEWQDAVVTIYTSAQTLDTTDGIADAIKLKTDYLPSVAAGASGGVFIAGANAATSVATALTANITGNLSGSVGSVTGAVGSVTGAVGSVTGAVGSVTGNVGGNVTGSVGSVTGAVGSVTGNVGGNVTGSVGSLATQAKADVNAEVVDAVATDIIADSIPADGSRPTMAQALYMLVQFMNERSVSSTTVTVKKADGATALYTLTLNDAGTPTAITRAT